jgi:signal transduction histidine kinase
MTTTEAAPAASSEKATDAANDAADEATDIAAINEHDVDQILDNLIDNAITYAPGRVTVAAGRSNGRVFLSVEDQGPGIAPDDQEHLTERFFRGRGAPPGGSGLGLAIVKELAEQWEGTVEIHSRVDAGTRVDVLLPRASEEDE